MARQASILIPSCEVAVKLTPGASTASAVQTIGKNRIFVINADQDISIGFGLSTGATAVASTSVGYRIPANSQVTLDTGQAFNQFMICNLSSTTAANVYYQTLSVV